MAGRQGQGTNLDHYKPWPIDYRLLELMPDEGLIGGVHPKGRTAKALADEINEMAGQILTNATRVGTRLRIMREIGYAVRNPATGGYVWARTVSGRKFQAAHQLADMPQPTEESDDGVGDQASGDPNAVVKLEERRTASG